MAAGAAPRATRNPIPSTHPRARTPTPHPHTPVGQESGPLWTTSGGAGLEPNSWSWNNFTNALFLEAPACVGFSYADDPNGGCRHNDTGTAADNLAAVIQWFSKYPEYQKNDFWITGESYAGIYIPTLAYNIYNYNSGNPATPINLKGA